MGHLHGRCRQVIRVERVSEPPLFDRNAREKGNKWLAEHPDAKPHEFPDYWSPFRSELARGFNHLCAYSVMRTGNPTVDHFIPKSSSEGRKYVYEWSNYRYADHDINRAKTDLIEGILDPFDVGSDWFEILLPNLEMFMTDRVPEGYRGDARATLRQLDLEYGSDILEKRRSWYHQFYNKKDPSTESATLTQLELYAPLIARAVQKRLSEIPRAALDDAGTWFDEFVAGTHTLKTLRARVPRLATIVEEALNRPDPRLRRRS